MRITFKRERRQGTNAHGSSILLGVEDMDRAKRFYPERLGWQVQQDDGSSVFFEPHSGSLAGFYAVFASERITKCRQLTNL
jgi:predicted enzyme related to lactoylglutathione lyase